MVHKVPIVLLLALFLVSSVGAQTANNSYFWNSYGGDYNPLYMAQYTTAQSNWNATNVQSSTMANGYSPQFSSFLSFYGSATPMQPLVSDLASNRNGYIVIPNGNYLQVYNSNRQLVNEQLAGTVVGQIDMTDRDGDGSDDIAGLWATNNTAFSFRIYSFNASTGLFTSPVNYNVTMPFAGSNVNSSGVRCVDGTNGYCYAVAWAYNNSNYLNTFTTLYFNGTYTMKNISSTFAPMAEPLAWIDADNDGTLEFLTYSPDKVIVIDENGVIKRTFTSSFAGGASMDTGFRGARWAKVDATPQWRIATSQKTTSACGGGTFNCAYVQVFKMDGSTLWSQALSASNSGDFMDISNLAIGDYNSDNFDDIYVIEKRTVNNQYAKFRAFKGSDGTSLMAVTATGVSTNRGDNAHVMLARMDSDNSPEVIALGGGAVTVYSPALSAYFLQGTGNGCGIGDLNYDSMLELVCSTGSATNVYSTNFTNVNAVLHSVAFSPSLSVAVGSPLSAVYNASDTEGNSIFYSGSCGDGTNITESLSNVRSCTYSNIGSYTFTGQVRDGYHTSYSTPVLATITVTQTGAVCNANGVCESGIGETNSNCPSDCTSSTGSFVGGNAGQTSLPSELVSTTNENDGLLPTIYFGIMGFLSYALIPSVIFITLIFFVLIIIAFGRIIKNIANSVGK